jgi:hypothetical protein
MEQIEDLAAVSDNGVLLIAIAVHYMDTASESS